MNRPFSFALLFCALSLVSNAQSVASRARFLVTATRATQPLAKDKIVVQVDGSPAEVSDVNPVQSEPMGFVVLIDVSGSSRNNAAFETRASLELFARLVSLNHFGFFGDFNDELYLDRSTSSLKAAEKEIQQVEFRGGSAIYDSVLQSARFLLKELKKRPEQKHCRRTIFVISDGEDLASTANVDDVVRELQKTGITVHVICLSANRIGRKIDQFVTLSSETGGSSVVLSGPEDFIGPLLSAIDSQYWVSITSNIRPNGKLHRLAVSSPDSTVRLLVPTAVMLE